MEQLDLSVLSTTEKDKVIKDMLDGTMSIEEARTYLQKTMAGVKDQKSKALATTLKDGNPETGEVPLESPHAAYRNLMVDYAKENESEETAEKVEHWHELTQQFIKEGSIKESDQGKELVGTGLRSVSKTVHDSVVKKAFTEEQYVTENYLDHQGTPQPCIAVRKEVLDAFMDDPHKSFEGTNQLMSKEDLNIMLAWIGKKYKTDNKTEQMYILQMINPDIVWYGWMNDTNGNYRSYRGSARAVFRRDIFAHYDPNHICSLSLVQKC